MTVQELIARLETFDPEAMVYVPFNTDGKNDTVRFVAHIPPTIDERLPGIRMPSGVALLPGEMEQFVVASDAPIEERMGDD